MNKCKYKDICNIAAVDGTCTHCKGHTYEDCGQYQSWEDNTDDNTCPYKYMCSGFNYPFGCAYSDKIEICPYFEDFEQEDTNDNEDFSNQSNVLKSTPQKQKKRRKRDDELITEELAERNKRREENKRRRELQEIEDKKDRKNNLILLIALFAISLSLIIIGLIFR